MTFIALSRISTCLNLNKSLFLRQSLFKQCSSDVKVLRERSLKVPSSGRLSIRSACNVHVQPTDTMDFPSLDQAFVKVLSSDGESDVIKIAIDQDGDELIVSDLRTVLSESHYLNDGYEEDKLSDITLHVEVPIVYDVSVLTSGRGNISCRGMIESSYCRLISDEGDIRVTGVKTQSLEISSATGDILCSGAIQGNVSITSGSGDVTSDKRFLGPSLDISTDSGDISVSSSYSDQSRFSTQTGNMNLRNVHNQSDVSVNAEGRVKMTGLDGATNVFLKKGDLEVQISCVQKESRIHVKEGDIILKMADSHPLKLCVKGYEVTTDETFAKYGKVINMPKAGLQNYVGYIKPSGLNPRCEVLADSGKVSISAQGWAQSLGFNIK